MAAIGADVGAHVLDDADDGDADLLEHLEALARVEQRDVLRRGDDDRTRDRHLLRQRELDVAGARRQVDHEIVELAPVGLAQQLLERAGDHRAAPYHGRFRVDEEADRHRLYAVAFERLHAFSVPGLGLGRDAEHLRLRRTIDIGIENADAGAFGSERESQVGRGGGLADAALAGRDGDDVLDARNQLHAALNAVRDDLGAHIDEYAADARQGLELVGDELLDLRGYGLGGVAQHDIEGDVVAVHADVAGGLGGDEILAGIGIDDLLEGSLDLLLGKRHG